MSNHLESVASIIGERGRKVISVMKGDFSYPMHITAKETGLSKHAVRLTMKMLRGHGLVQLGPWFDEDDGLIQGSGYFLTVKGEGLKEHLDGQ